MTFKLPAIVLLVIIALVAFGPLAFFVPPVGGPAAPGDIDYGTLGQIHSIHFHEKRSVNNQKKSSHVLSHRTQQAES